MRPCGFKWEGKNKIFEFYKISNSNYNGTHVEDIKWESIFFGPI